MKTKRENECRSPFVIHSRGLYVEKSKWIYIIGVGIVKGFGFQTGAIVTTVVHDSHHLIVVETNDEDMLTAIETIQRVQGGMVIINNGEVLAEISLKIAGLISEQCS
ncbi:adenine deaminase C-terminal domain-containing protein [Bacillus sp. DX1.1]|uniref:adenine deaminase C-terminal domain-containing protein n=1 Tax=unclassified Bacillus (in: firmicutes) TaxID=185979 RepID=UPI00256FCCA9|nr:MULTISPECIES: adenine deaminase C-terminal domain-containing protein [unclassified Bacillus (in: firmicutes)]MDM5154836.1 adenine deaminase C-terminal domain-containing protein [Bacillus sp. DX1.1]WJE83711.1 adenine deaminase C-terminal domain-containing protein [Bacillus sp. DX3.1]